MSLMLKLLATALLLSSTVFASSSDKVVEKFLEKKFKSNPNIVSLKVKVKEKIAIKKLQGWDAYIVNVDAMVKAKPKNRKVSQKMIWFYNGEYITQDFISVKTGMSLKDLVRPPFKDEYYRKENLIFGNADAKHKIAIFSDPLCPFCREYVPKALKDLKKSPEKFAVYYYHFPLPSLHPAAVELSKAAIAAEIEGQRNVIEKLYRVQLNPKERDVKKILKAFNKALGTHIKPSDLRSPEVMKRYQADQDLAELIMVQGTPTMYFDGKVDKSKKKYKKVQ